MNALVKEGFVMLDRGVMLLFPLSDPRLFFLWRPIHVSPLGVSRFLSNAAYILRSEMPF
jgi:hypothetical protein